MTNQKLLQDGYKLINLVVLHDAGVVIQPTNAGKRDPWWKEYPSVGKSFTIDGNALADLAEMMGIKARSLKCKGKNGRVSYQGLTSISIPLGHGELEENRSSAYPIQSLLGKVENSVLHLVAFFQDGEPYYSSHGGSFDISWSRSSINENQS